MKNELLHIGPFTVYGYGLMIAVGVLAAYLTTEYRAKKLKYRQEHVFPMFMCCLIGGIAGAKILFWITEWKFFVQNPAGYLMNFADGFVVFGGIITGVLTGVLYCRANGLSFAAWADLILPPVALGQAFGRIGCFLAGCCYGKETSLPFGIVFRHSEFAPNGVRLIPTQLLSSGLDFLNFLILLWISRRTKREGMVTACYLIFYSVGRFFLEFLRGDMGRGTVGIFSTSQFISILTFAGAAIWMVGQGHVSQLGQGDVSH